MSETNVNITVEIGADEYAYLLAEANIRKMTVSELTNALLDDYLRRNDG